MYCGVAWCSVPATLTHCYVSCTSFHPPCVSCVCLVCAGFHWLGVRNFRMKYLCAMCDHFQVELFNGNGWHLVYLDVCVCVCVYGLFSVAP